MKAVKVTWIDAESTTEWTAIEDLKEPGSVHTLGYLVKETEDTYFVASSAYQNEKGGITAGDTIAIPKAWVKELYEIKENVKKKASRRS